MDFVEIKTGVTISSLVFEEDYRELYEVYYRVVLKHVETRIDEGRNGTKRTSLFRLELCEK